MSTATKVVRHSGDIIGIAGPQAAFTGYRVDFPYKNSNVHAVYGVGVIDKTLINFRADTKFLFPCL